MSCSRFIIQIGHSVDSPFISRKMKTKAWDQDDPHKNMNFAQMATDLKEELSYLTVEQLAEWIHMIAVKEEEFNIRMQMESYRG